VARAIAGEVDAAFFHVLPSDILSKWVGDPEKTVRALFRNARGHPRAVVFFDEIDGLAGSRRRGEDYMRRVVNQLLAEMQGFDRHGNAPLVLGATNHPDLLDPAFLRPGRFDELVYVPLPDREVRTRLWRIHLDRRERGGPFDYERLADESDGYSGAEVALVCDRAAVKAFRRCTAGDRAARIRMSDVRAALATVSPRTSPDDLAALTAFARRFDRNLDPRTTG
jgi:transitional endoplasmic reticulum ATPase